LNILGNGRVVEQHRAHAENAACFDKRNGPAELLLQCRCAGAGAGAGAGKMLDVALWI